MGVKETLLENLRLPGAKKLDDLDDPEATEFHSRVIREKRFLNRLYEEYYKRFSDALGPLGKEDVVVELGSGGGFIKEMIPQAIRSDILQISTIDICFSAQQIPFKDNKVNAFLMIDVFHHIKEAETFLRELDRCLKPGGKIVMIEPANTPWARFIWVNFHHENFDPKAGWKIEGQGPLSCANGALPWIVFVRDKEKFLESFKRLKIEQTDFHTPFRYLISGGISMKQLLPSCFYGVVKFMEILLTPLNRWVGMFFTITLKKEEGNG